MLSTLTLKLGPVKPSWDRDVLTVLLLLYSLCWVNIFLGRTGLSGVLINIYIFFCFYRWLLWRDVSEEKIWLNIQLPYCSEFIHMRQNFWTQYVSVCLLLGRQRSKQYFCWFSCYRSESFWIDNVKVEVSKSSI